MNLNQIKMNIQKTIAHCRSGIAFVVCRRLARKRLRFLTRVITTRAFSKLRLCDKITSIARLIMISRCDYGATPKKLEEKLVSLSGDLKRQELEQIDFFKPNR